MSTIIIDNGELLIRVPIQPNGTLSIDTFNRISPNATTFLFKRKRSNAWTEMKTDDNGDYVAPNGIWSEDMMYKVYDARSPRRRSSRSPSSSISWNRFFSRFGNFLWPSSLVLTPKKNQ